MERAVCKKLFDFEDSTYLNYFLRADFQILFLKT